MFSKACEYGIRAVIHISDQSLRGDKSSLKEIANAIDSPVAFTAKILQSLTKHDIILSAMGPTGGYTMRLDQKRPITLFDIVKAIDGDKIYSGCGMGLAQCNELKPCPIHNQFKAIRDSLHEMLQTTTIFQLTTELAGNKAFLRR